jgi:hypothetical protein
MWCDMRTDPIYGCFNNPEGLNNRHLPSRHSPRVRELANSLRLGTVVPSQDLSGVYVTVRDVSITRRD